MVVDPNRDDYNVIAESKGGDKNHVVVVDAHLDAIYGAGMLDNASGSATILDIAEKMRNVHPRTSCGSSGSAARSWVFSARPYYVNNLSPAELSHIGYDLDADVTATPNYLIGVLDPAAPGPLRPDRDARRSRTTCTSRRRSRATWGSTTSTRSARTTSSCRRSGTDAFSFNTVGVPASGVLTGQDCCKLQEEVDLFGGNLGNYEGNLGSFDGGCVDNPFRWCDNLGNNDPEVLTFMSRTFANMVIRMAFDTKVMSASNSVTYKPHLPIAAEAARHFTAK